MAPEEVEPFRVCRDLSDATRQFTDGNDSVAFRNGATGAVREQRKSDGQRPTVPTEEAQQ